MEKALSHVTVERWRMPSHGTRTNTVRTQGEIDGRYLGHVQKEGWWRVRTFFHPCLLSACRKNSFNGASALCKIVGSSSVAVPLWAAVGLSGCITSTV